MPPSIAKHCLLAVLSTSAAMLSAPASASTPEAWDEFRKEVETACMAAAADTVPNARIVVDPFGSESYGIAFLSSADVASAGQSTVCIFDKQAKTVEIGGTMALENAVPELAAAVDVQAATEAPQTVDLDPNASGRVVTSEAAPSSEPAPAVVPDADSDPAAPVSLAERLLVTPTEMPATDPIDPTIVASLAQPAAALAPSEPASDSPPLFAGQCDAECSVTLTALAEADRNDLVALAGRIGSTIEPDSALADAPSAVRDAMAAVAASASGTASDAIAAPSATLVGTSSCVLYYFGYSNEAVRTVGRHRCAVSEVEGGLRVEKTSGERLQADIRPLTDTMSAFVGRTFDAGENTQAYDPESPTGASSDTGNAVGYAVEEDGRLLLVSSQMRRFPTDDEFFWVLALDRP